MKRVDTSIRTFRQATGLACLRAIEQGFRALVFAADFNIDNTKHSP